MIVSFDLPVATSLPITQVLLIFWSSTASEVHKKGAI